MKKILLSLIAYTLLAAHPVIADNLPPRQIITLAQYNLLFEETGMNAWVDGRYSVSSIATGNDSEKTLVIKVDEKRIKDRPIGYIKNDYDLLHINLYTYDWRSGRNEFRSSPYAEVSINIPIKIENNRIALVLPKQNEYIIQSNEVSYYSRISGTVEHSKKITTFKVEIKGSAETGYTISARQLYN